MSRRLSRLSLVLAGGLLATTLVGCSGDATRDEGSQEITASGDADVFSMQVGDCFDDGSMEAEITEVPVVPCADPHDNEVYFAFDMPEGDWPGDEAVAAAAEETCTPEFETFVGMDYESSELDWFPITPTQGGWDGADDREIVCSVWDPAGKTSGTLKGAAR